ncbi:MAG: glycosyltransferase [Rickettsiales bacterium]|nr:glycosyltransferase [Rickettsiales bacterium]
MVDAPEMRIIHVTVYSDLPSGVRKQISWEQKASKELVGIEWNQLALHGGESKEAFEKRIPAIFRLIILRNLYAWVVVRRLCRTYDFVLLRHMPFDPFVFLFAPFLSNRIGIHHSKEIEELRLIRSGFKGKLASFLERFSGKCAVKNARAILGVTPEIAQYQVELRAAGKPYSVYANGIDMSSVELLPDNRDSQKIEVAFICHTFSRWHGLDRLFDAIKEDANAELPTNRSASLIIHLIGNLSDEQRMTIETIESLSSVIEIHGHLESDDYRSLLSRCDIGIGSLAMDRQSLTQGTTLKVREMLALGLPVYSGHEDSSLPENFAYYKNNKIAIPDMCEFARLMQSHTRGQVREDSAPYIEKVVSMQKVIHWLQSL